MLACLDRGSRTLLAVQAANRFGVSVLHAGQEPIARAFATKAPVADKWDGVAWSERDGIPAIDDALAWVACDLRDVIAGGDHVIVTGEVTRPGDRRGRPARLPRRRVPAAGLSDSEPRGDPVDQILLNQPKRQVDHDGRTRNHDRRRRQHLRHDHNRRDKEREQKDPRQEKDQLVVLSSSSFQYSPVTRPIE